MHYRRCPASACGRPFQVNRFSASLCTLTETGKIICPHCGAAIKADSDTIFLTHALSDEEEKLFEDGKLAIRNE
jgi:hypothetical protein